jgi:pilus assembly protein CpaF
MVIQEDVLSRQARELAIDLVLDSKFERETLTATEEQNLRLELNQKLTGLGFLQSYLDDESIEEVWVNQPGEVWFAKAGLHFSERIGFSADELMTLVERMIRVSGRRLDRSTPFIDAQLDNGFRLHAVIPDVTRKHLSLNIRKFSNRVMTLDELANRGVLSLTQAEFLVAELKAGANVIISGATQAGKTTLLTALLSSLDLHERVVSVEDTFELRCLLPDWVAMQTRPESLEGKYGIDMRRLVRESLRMRPTRLVVGEVRGAESLDMLIAMNSGIPGMCTVHANSSDEALNKLRTLPLLAGGNISNEFISELVGSSLRLFVHCSRDSSGKRQISSIKRMAEGKSMQLESVVI